MGLQKSLSRRDFLKMSVLAAGGVASAGMLGMPYLTLAQDTTELTLVAPGRELGIKYWDVIIEGFNAKMQAEGKPFRVKQSPGPATDNDYVTKITLDAASGTLGDVVSVNAARYEDMAAAGYLADLTGLLEGNADWEQYSQVVKDQLAIDGKIYGVADAGTFTLYYRKDLLEEAGIPTDQPATWEDFYGIADQILTKTGATPIGIPAARAWGGGTWEEGFRHVWLGFAESNEIFDPADNKWVVKSDGLLKALQVYETLATNKWLTVDALLSPNPWEPIKYQGFPNKTVGVVTGGDWQWEFDWGPNGATPIEGLFENVERWKFPSAIGDPFVFVGIGGPMSVYSQSKNIDAALEFILYAGSPAGSCLAMETYLGGPSARKDFADNCEFYTTAINGKIAEAGALLESGRSLKAGVGQGKIADGIALATEEVITLAKPAQQAMDDFAANMLEQLGEEAIKEL